MIGYAFCGSFCTWSDSFRQLERLLEMGWEIQPIMSETAYQTDTRFGKAEEWQARIRAACGKEIVHTIADAEPFGPAKPLEYLIISPCTGNTLAKMSCGITDSAVCMAAKAHLRTDRPLIIALASNDAMSANLKNIGTMLTRQSVYFVPMIQDDPIKKPHSLVADFRQLPETLLAVREGKQPRPLFTHP